MVFICEVRELVEGRRTVGGLGRVVSMDERLIFIHPSTAYLIVSSPPRMKGGTDV